MKFFVNTTANTESLVEIQNLAKTGMLDGVTTNPISCNDPSEFNNLAQFVKEIPPYFNGHVIVECTATKYEAILKKGETLVDRNKNVIVTVPFTQDGLCACSALTKQKIKVNVALCYSLTQALLAAEAGAAYISITADQLKNTNHDGISLIEEICDIYKKYEYGTQILLTSINISINNWQQVEQAARIGVHAVVIPYLEAFSVMIEEPLLPVRIV